MFDDRQVDPPSRVRYAIQPPPARSSAQMFDASTTTGSANRSGSRGWIQCSPWSLETYTPIPVRDAHHVPDCETPASSISIAFPAGPITIAPRAGALPGPGTRVGALPGPCRCWLATTATTTSITAIVATPSLPRVRPHIRLTLHLVGFTLDSLPTHVRFTTGGGR